MNGISQAHRKTPLRGSIGLICVMVRMVGGLALAEQCPLPGPGYPESHRARFDRPKMEATGSLDPFPWPLLKSPDSRLVRFSAHCSDPCPASSPTLIPRKQSSQPRF